MKITTDINIMVNDFNSIQPKLEFPIHRVTNNRIFSRPYAT